MQTINKTQAVLKHLKSGRKISSWDAIQKYRATRLSAIIFTLIEQGHDIRGEWVENKKEKTRAYFYKLVK